MSHAFSAIAGALLMAGALKCSAVEPYWAWAFVLAFASGIAGAVAEKPGK